MIHDALEKFLTISEFPEQKGDRKKHTPKHAQIANR